MSAAPPAARTATSAPVSGGSGAPAAIRPQIDRHRLTTARIAARRRSHGTCFNPAHQHQDKARFRSAAPPAARTAKSAPVSSGSGALAAMRPQIDRHRLTTARIAARRRSHGTCFNPAHQHQDKARFRSAAPPAARTAKSAPVSSGSGTPAAIRRSNNRYRMTTARIAARRRSHGTRFNPAPQHQDKAPFQGRCAPCRAHREERAGLRWERRPRRDTAIKQPISPDHRPDRGEAPLPRHTLQSCASA